MRTKIDEAERADEADHDTERSKAELTTQGNAGPEITGQERQLIENPDMDTLEEEIRNDPLLSLLRNRKSMDQLDAICQKLTNKFGTSNIYPWQDVKGDVLAKLIEARSDFRGESSLSTWLYRIVHNEIVDFCRKKGNKAPSIEGTTLRGKDGQEYELDGEETEGGKPSVRYVKNYRNEVERRRHDLILFRKVANQLTEEEKELLSKYFGDGMTMTAIGEEEGRTRQAVSKQIDRILRRVRKELGLDK